MSTQSNQKIDGPTAPEDRPVLKSIDTADELRPYVTVYDDPADAVLDFASACGVEPISGDEFLTDYR